MSLPCYHEVQVLGLIDHAIELKQLISQDRQDIHKSFHVQGDIQQLVFQLLEQGDLSGDFRPEQRHIKIGQGNYNERIEGNSYKQEGNFGIGHMSGGEIKDNAKIAGVINEAEQQNLAQVAEDLQTLLEQLEETYPTNTTMGKMAIATEAIQRIDNNPKLTPRILSALKAGGTSALDSLLDHPAASFVIGALEDWQQTKGS